MLLSPASRQLVGADIVPAGSHSKQVSMNTADQMDGVRTDLAEKACRRRYSFLSALPPARVRDRMFPAIHVIW